jgi:hypothetical protein
MTRLLTLPLRLFGVLALAVLVSGVWLYRREIGRMIAPRVARVSEALGAGPGPAAPAPESLARAHDKVDSMQGWSADSVLLTAGEMASLLDEGMPAKIREHLDSLAVSLGEGRVKVAARLDTRAIPGELLGPLAGALDPWERVSVEGPLVSTSDGHAEWRIDALALRGFTLPAEASRRLVDRGMPGARDGVVPLALPRGVVRLRVRPTGVALYRKETR